LSVAVVIPWRPGCPHREAAKGHVIGWWAAHYPDVPVVVGVDEPGGMWSKGRAVADALGQVDAEVVVVSDADVIVEDIHLAISAVEQGAPWAVPFRAVYRLSPAATVETLETGLLPTGVASRRSWWLEDLYTGQPGGGMVVLPTRTARDIPIDPRYIGWGQEDLSWARALWTLAGAPWRSTSPLWHLWHPRAPRMSPGIGSPEGLALWTRYRNAIHPDLMRPLVAEARAALSR
jgi:hypothetical protein